MCLRYTQNLSHLNQQATMRNNQPHGTVLCRQHAHLHVPNLKGGPLAAGAQGHGEHSGRGSKSRSISQPTAPGEGVDFPKSTTRHCEWELLLWVGGEGWEWERGWR